MGHTAEKIEQAVLSCPQYSETHPNIHHVSDMQGAVSLAHELAAPGDVVSLSPASASFDLYPGFEARGRHFKELVSRL